MLDDVAQPWDWLAVYTCCCGEAVDAARARSLGSLRLDPARATLASPRALERSSSAPSPAGGQGGAAGDGSAAAAAVQSLTRCLRALGTSSRFWSEVGIAMQTTPADCTTVRARVVAARVVWHAVCVGEISHRAAWRSCGVLQSRVSTTLTAALRCVEVVLAFFSDAGQASAEESAHVATLVPADVFDDAILLSQEFFRARRASPRPSTARSRLESPRSPRSSSSGGSNSSGARTLAIIAAAVSVTSALAQFFYAHCGVEFMADMVGGPDAGQMGNTLTRAHAASLAVFASAAAAKRGDATPALLSHSQAVAFVQALHRWHGEAPTVLPELMAAGVQEVGRAVGVGSSIDVRTHSAALGVVTACLTCLATLAAQVGLRRVPASVADLLTV